MEDSIITAPKSPRPSHKPYGRTKTNIVRLLYVIAAIVWTVLIFILGLWRTGAGIDPLAIIILIIPYVIFLFGFINASALSHKVEKMFQRANYMTVGLLIALPLMAWMIKNYGGDKRQFICIVVTALILSLVSLMEVWTSYKWHSCTRHIRSTLNTMALTLLIYLLYLFYLHHDGQSDMGLM